MPLIGEPLPLAARDVNRRARVRRLRTELQILCKLHAPIERAFWALEQRKGQLADEFGERGHRAILQTANERAPALKKETRIPVMNSIRTFRHCFAGGVTCEIAVNLERIAAKATGPMRCEWSERPKPRVIPKYPRWILSVWQHIADETGLKLMELLQVKPRLWEAWSFEPGRAPVKVEEVSV